MNQRNKTIRYLGFFLYAAGIILGIAFQGGTVWADFEASIFDSTLPENWADTDLHTLSCPLIISSTETGTIKASFTNNTEKDVNQRIRLHISDGLVTLLREENTILPIAPGETKQAQWNVYPEDAAWEHFILVRIYQFRAYQIPSRSASCGVLLINLFNLPGNQIVIFIVVASLSCMLTGLALLIYANRPLKDRALSTTVAMIILIILVIIGSLMSFSGSWVAGFGILLVTLLLLVALLPFALRIQQLT